MKSEKIGFRNSSGQELAARLEIPTQQSDCYAIFAHCFTCSKDIAAASRISRGLAERGIGVLRFDFTGLGHSEGDFANTNFSSNVQDLVAAAQHLRDIGKVPQLLVGHSLGGAAVLVAGSMIPEVKAIATIGAPYEPEHVIENFQADLEQIESQGQAEVKLAGRRFTIKKQFVDDLRKQAAENAVHALRKALLIFHSPQDATVGVENAQKIYEAALHPKSFVSLNGADHLLSKKEDSEYVAEVLSSWAGRYLDLATPKEEGVSLGHGEVLVTEKDGGLTQEVRSEDHMWLADEPTSVTLGNNRGPTPYDLLLAALGACTSMTLRMYANHKKLALENVSVKLHHKRVHAKDCEECESDKGFVDLFERELKVEGDLDEATRQRLLEIADRCPVHKTLDSENRIETKLVT